VWSEVVQRNILCYSESAAITAEMATLGHKLSEGGEVVCATTEDIGDVEARKLLAYGATKVYLLELVKPQERQPDSVAQTLQKLVPAQLSLVLIGATKFGKEVAARLGAKMDAPVATECRRVEFTDSGVAVERMVFSGNGVATEELLRLPSVVSVQPATIQPAEVAQTGGRVERVKLSEASSTVTLEVKKKEGSGSVKLEEAERIVAAGRGIQKKEDLAMIEELAKVLGAAVGGSRPLAADLGWLSDDQWIGLSGHKVKPKLYVAVGISGQVQHIAGMRDSKTVVAINKDPNAPISLNSDYYVVGDLYKIVPELVKALKT
jgi:electron transfer flavoprotein alpha subunit